MAQEAARAASELHGEWISPVREWIEGMIRLAEDENVTEDDFFAQLQNGLNSLPETRDDVLIDRLWALQMDGFKTGWEADWNEEVVLSGKCRAKDPSRCRVHGHPRRGRGRKDWLRPMPGLTDKQNISNVNRALKWAINNRKSLRSVMHRKELGWIDIPYGQPGDKNNDYKGGKGLSHLMGKHHGIEKHLAEMLVFGKVRNHQVGHSRAPKSDRRTIEYKNKQIHLVKNQKSRAWVLTSY